MLRKLTAAVLVLCAVPSPSYAWGFTAHRLIMRRAIEILPAELEPFFVAHRDELVARVVDPDMWRTIGWDDDPNHFVNFGAPELGPAPFTNMPRDYTAALQKFGPVTLDRLGRLPWREAEMFGDLQRAFATLGDANPFAVERIVVFAAAAAHYIQDATQPLHASNNYNGQLSGQLGVHSRFEAELIERFGSALTLSPGPLQAVPSPRDYAFDILLASYPKATVVLKADKDAIGAGDTYDDAYYQKFFAGVKSTLEERMSMAITATASIIASAWEQAGRPSLVPSRAVRPPQKVQRAR